MVTPISRAVRRLKITECRVMTSIGISLGLAPLRIFSTYPGSGGSVSRMLVP